MKTLVFALLLALTFAHYSQLEKVTLFNEWSMLNNRVYPTDEIEWFRFQVFSQNLELAEKMKEISPSATFGMTQFADITNDEFELLYFGYNYDQEIPADVESTPLPADVANDIDWTTKGAVTAIKNQGQCGSCWAFSTTGNLEGKNFIAHQTLVALSEQQLVDCDTVDEGCKGGLMDNAFTWLKGHGGITTEAKYPYKGVKQTCKFVAGDAVVQVTGFIDIAKGDEGAMATNMADETTGGPLAIAIHANGLQLYTGGIFDPAYCSKQLNHGVLGVGYGNEGKDFWKIKNSWGAGWGERGYFRIIRGKNMCGLANAVSTATVA